MQKTAWIRFGDFLFKYRNKFFPCVMVVLFLSFDPASEYFGQRFLEIYKDGIALLITFSGLLLRASVIGFAYIKRGGLNKRVYAENLVTEGFFGVCRNPLYLGNMLIYSGIFLMHGSAIVFVLGTVLYFIFYSSIIAAEEFFLLEKFGDAYRDYCRDVPRWVPRFLRLDDAIYGMEFNVKRVLFKDYPTIGTTVGTLIFLELLERYHEESGAVFMQSFAVCSALLFLVLAFVGGVLAVKKKRRA